MADTKEKLRRDVATVNKFASANMHQIHCAEYVAIKQVCAALSDVLNAATPPADAALADIVTKAAQMWADGSQMQNDLIAAAAALRARPQAVAEGYALVDVSLIDDEWMAAAMRDAGIVRAVGAPPETIIRAAISGYLLAASQSAAGGA